MRVDKLKRLVDPARPITYGIVQAGPEFEGGIPYIRPADMTDESGVKDIGSIKHTSPEIAQQYHRSAVQAGDLVISIGPSFGKVMEVPSELEGANLTQGTARVAPGPSLNARFAFWCLRSRHCYSQWEAGIGGATFRALNLGPLAETRLPNPDLASQRQIADFLDRETARIDLLIEKKQRLVALLGEKAEETIRQCVSWGLDSNVSKKPSRVPAGDDLAEHWSEQPLSTVCRFVQGKAHEPFIEEDGEYICVTARFVSTNGEKYRRCTRNLTPAKVNDIAMVMSDLPNGRALARAFLVDQNQLYAINQRVCLITVLEGDPRFFYYQLNRNVQLLRYNDGFNQTHLPNRAFTKMYLKVPPVEEQKRIADYLDTLSKKTTALSHKTVDCH